MEEELLQAAKKRFPERIDDIEKALGFAKNAHSGQKRKDGPSYITHPVAAAQFLLETNHETTDADTIIAALLHDTVEDCETTLEEIETAFGEEVKSLVEAVTKKPGQRREAFYKQIRTKAADDPRIWLVRIADQQHNAQTLHVHRDSLRKTLAEYKLRDIAPKAEELGLKDTAARVRKNAKKHL